MDTKNIPPHQYSRCRGLQPGSPQHLLLSFHTTAFRARAFATPPVPLRTSSPATHQPLLSKQSEKNFCGFLRNRQQCRTSIVDLLPSALFLVFLLVLKLQVFLHLQCLQSETLALYN
uniref:Uncharacterized protein n=1 Tax=Corvus moneduloides TaxID=1196302 RepID=A0A8C3EGV5_CORMO